MASSRAIPGFIGRRFRRQDPAKGHKRRQCYHRTHPTIAASMATPDVVTASITYLLPPPNGERAYQTINADPTTGERRKNIIRKDFDAPIENVRGKEHTFTLDNAGFQFAHRPTKFKDFRNDKKVLQDYYLESEALIKELTGASRAVFFDHSTCYPESF